MKIKTRRYVHHTLTLDDDIELDIDIEPYNVDDTLVERVGENIIVIGYLAHDSIGFSSNPMENCYGQGHIYTRNEGVITDNEPELMGVLGLDSYGYVDLDREFTFTPYVDYRGILQTRVSLRDLGAAVIWNELEADREGAFSDWLIQSNVGTHPGFSAEEIWIDLQCQRELWAELLDSNGYFSEGVTRAGEDLYPEYWQDVAGPYVVPLHYSSGRGNTSITLADWDGDPAYPPNAVWVADAGAEENIGDGATYGITLRPERRLGNGKQWAVIEDRGREVARLPVEEGRYYWDVGGPYIEQHYSNRPNDIRTAAEAYAEAIADEYAKWCSGEVYGVVTQVFRLQPDGTWLGEDHDSCWGFVGEERAGEALESDYFRPVVNRIKKEAGHELA